MKRTFVNPPKDQAEMTFEEIGKKLGITRAGAAFLYNSGLKKLRANKKIMEKLKRAA